MPRYVIERDIPEIGSAERVALREASQKSNGVRLMHYWLFAALTVGIGCMVYAQLAMTHGDYSGTASGLGTFNPQFYVGLFGAYFYLWLFVGLIFFAFEIRKRDERDQIVDVLDSRPFSNAEYVVGKFCALVPMAWLPILALMALLEAAGHLAHIPTHGPWSRAGRVTKRLCSTRRCHKMAGGVWRTTFG